MAHLYKLRDIVLVTLYLKYNYMKHTYKVSGMTCGGCQAKVLELLSKVSDVKM